jgi:hypothetical protein
MGPTSGRSFFRLPLDRTLLCPLTVPYQRPHSDPPFNKTTNTNNNHTKAISSSKGNNNTDSSLNHKGGEIWKQEWRGRGEMRRKNRERLKNSNSNSSMIKTTPTARKQRKQLKQ